MRTVRHILVTFGTIITVAVIIFGIGLWNFRTRALYTKEQAKMTLTDAAKAMKNGDPGKAGLYLASISDELRELNATFAVWGKFVPFLKNAITQLHEAQGLADASVDVAHDLDYLKREGAQLMLGGKGNEFIAALKRLKGNIEKIAPAAQKEQVYEALTVIDAATAWLDRETPHNLVILFQNPSEIRPGGGFLGSFAQLTLHKASMTGLEVQDIYDLDGQLTKNVIPPVPLQRLTTKWGARDANWFPDYPTSARKVMQFLEDSRIFRDRGIRFSGAIAINVNVLKDILEITGPMDIPQDDGSTMTVTADTFLAEVQNDVETKQNKGILKKTTPVLFAKLNVLDDAGKKALVAAIAKRFTNKDVMAYFSDPLLESFMQRMGAGGELYQTPADFSGGYLSVNLANIAGGKADAYTENSILVDETVNRDGTIVSTTRLTRTHRGDTRTERFYNVPNRTYIRFLTAPGTTLTKLEGGYDRTIKPVIDYAQAKYEIDPDLAGDIGKEVFPTWLDLDPGKTKIITATYARQSLLTFDAPETPYQFVFDKQSGVDGSLDITLHAPAGMVWKDSGSATFSYYTDNPPARVILDLTLVRK